MKVCVILGTRPEIIKMSPLIRLCVKKGHEIFILHTGQHYDSNLDSIFFKELRLPVSKYNLQVKSSEYSVQISRISKEAGKIIAKEKPDVVLVEGDTNSVLGGAIAGSTLGVPVGHVEAGLRSGDYRMKEEFNRILADNLSKYLFVPTLHAMKNLENEMFEREKSFLTGNIVVDALNQNMDIARNKSKVMEAQKLEGKEFCVITLHRAENVDERENLENLLEGLKKICDDHEMEFILPLHPRTKKMLKEHNLSLPANIRTIEPTGYLDFIWLMNHARIIITDSGGIQEEAAVLGKPCITLRLSTERPETVEAGVNIVTGYDPEKILAAFKTMMDKKIKPVNLYGDGTTAEKILDIVERKQR